MIKIDFGPDEEFIQNYERLKSARKIDYRRFTNQ